MCGILFSSDQSRLLGLVTGHPRLEASFYFIQSMGMESSVALGHSQGVFIKKYWRTFCSVMRLSRNRFQGHRDKDQKDPRDPNDKDRDNDLKD